MPRIKLHKARLKGMIALYKKRKIPHPVASAKGYMRGYNDVKRIRKGHLKGKYPKVCKNCDSYFG